MLIAQWLAKTRVRRLFRWRNSAKKSAKKWLRSVSTTDSARRYLNDGFSGGEKKRVEILQMSMLKPSMAVMDETDSGLDIDALKVVSQGVNTLLGETPTWAYW
jgi:Fe-S cluster assembly ATP-binding protein